MIKSCSDKIAFLFVLNQVIEKDDLEICSYGLEILLSSILNTLISLIIGLILGKFIYSIVFLISFCTIRQFSGGYHAANNKNCILIFNSIFFISMVLGIILNNSIPIPLFLAILSSFNLLSIFIFAPVCHVNNPLNETKYKKNKLISRVISSTLFLIVFLGCKYLTLYNYVVYTFLALSWINLLLIIQIIINKKIS
ncbi:MULTISPECIES: accessory gene regulator ArgB-like protein [unclassified Clostridioides]|uniref:accessory gene regulator ArgB-like protein n=1 Tax=unclassified Clostridioides TaxID=2635829 RepID=UPI0038A7A866